LYEVVDGTREEKPVSGYATWIADELRDRLSPFVRERQLGRVHTEMLFILDAVRNLRRRPDVAFVSAEKWPVGQPPPGSGDWDIVPELAVEVLSPSNTYEAVIRKLRHYFDCGVREVWLISPQERLVQVYSSLDKVRNVRRDEELATELIPGWSIPVAAIVPHEIDIPEDEYGLPS
jgi:Uma2 family endonuclease